MNPVLVGALRGRPYRRGVMLVVLLLRSPRPSASPRELLLALVMLLVPSAAYICFIRGRSQERGAWPYIPLCFGTLLTWHSGLVKCFLRLSLQPDDLVRPRLPHEHPSTCWPGLSPGPGQSGGGAARAAVDVPGRWGAQSPCTDPLWSSGDLRQSAGTNWSVGGLRRARGIAWGAGAAAEHDGVVWLAASWAALAMRNWCWDGAVPLSWWGGMDGLTWVPPERSVRLGAGTPGSWAGNGKRLFFAYAAVGERVCFHQHRLHLIFLFSFHNESFLPASRARCPGRGWGVPAPAPLLCQQLLPRSDGAAVSPGWSAGRAGRSGLANPAKPPPWEGGEGEKGRRPLSPSISFQFCSPSIKAVNF